MANRVVTLGSCYVDMNVAQYPFDQNGIPAERELVGGDYELMVGGSAPNFCRQAVKLRSLMPTFVGVVGVDDLGSAVEKLFIQDSIDARLYRLDGAKTGVSFNVTSPSGNHIMLTAGTANAHMDEKVIELLYEAIQDAQYVYIGGLFKLKGLIQYLPRIVEMVKQNNIWLAVDHGRIPEGTTPEQLAAVKQFVLSSDYYFPSNDEFTQLWGAASVEEGLDALTSQAPRLTTVVKAGEMDVHYKSPDDRGTVPTVKVETIGDVTGAGDTFNAAVLSALNARKSLQESIVYGCQVAAQKISA